ncbi:choice-of-anchor D domain-containing protein [Conexibacter stalactiti]|uniref:Choice-of-anchor D domain-containing protein n=1 Tax=Conexibacter stalactiti TaxID=1940611 RepID=A0ABU4HM91_9ACTN|nr:choice-of-anchor D domain-containing protein [Conexibacter stalactiti]MDW5593842.1 choice-of-anchor D domain-containing protein [Conexibacter stalactiti]MEC5034484.1 choice-of-anchor D domain-containing protein [Conexibacter stalactiti]
MLTRSSRLRRTAAALAAGAASLALADAATAATLTVTAAADSGAGTLRAALAAADDGDRIEFALPNPSSIVLASELVVDRAVTLAGPGWRSLELNGGGVTRVLRVSAAGVEIERLAIRDGSAPPSGERAYGGGLLVEQSGDATLREAVVEDNVAGGQGGRIVAGGGIWVGGVNGGNGGSLHVVRSAIVGNLASGVGSGGLAASVSGGGLGASTASASVVTIEDSTVAANTVDSTSDGMAFGNGGGIASTGFTSGRLLRSTVTANAVTVAGVTLTSASAGGAGDNTSSAWQSYGSIVAGNTVQAVPSDCSARLAGDHNVVGTSSGCAISGTGNSVVNPQLGAFGDHGGPTPSYALAPTSPALQAVPAGSTACPAGATDQRGVARPELAACDAGSYELRPGRLTVPADRDLGSAGPGDEPSQTVTVTATGDLPATFDAVRIDPAGGRFAVELDGCSVALVLQPGDSCNVTARFAPRASGADSATLEVDYSSQLVAAATLDTRLDGLGLGGEARVTPAGQSFAERIRGSGPSAPLAYLLENDGNNALLLDAVTLTGADGDQFTLDTSDCTAAAGAGGVLAPGASCALQLAFSPTTSGAKQATLSIAHDGFGPAATASASGVAVDPAPDPDPRPEPRPDPEPRLDPTTDPPASLPAPTPIAPQPQPPVAPQPQPAAPRAPALPRIAGLAVTPRCALPLGSRLPRLVARFRLAADARVTYRIQTRPLARPWRRCPRPSAAGTRPPARSWRTLSSVERTTRAGLTTVSVERGAKANAAATGALVLRDLAPGSYRLVITARNKAGTTRAIRNFVVLAPPAAGAPQPTAVR